MESVSNPYKSFHGLRFEYFASEMILSLCFVLFFNHLPFAVDTFPLIQIMQWIVSNWLSYENNTPFPNNFLCMANLLLNRAKKAKHDPAVSTLLPSVVSLYFYLIVESESIAHLANSHQFVLLEILQCIRNIKSCSRPQK